MGQGSSLGQSLKDKQSKLAFVKGVGSSYRGSRSWLLFKVSGAFSIPLSLYLFASLIMGNANSYQGLVSWMVHPFNAAVLIFAIITMSTHALFGALDVFDDYVHNQAVNFFGGLFLRFFFILVSLICILSVIAIMFRGMY